MKKIIIYDFDGTLTPYPMPKFEILEKLGIKDGFSKQAFINEIIEKTKKENLDLYETFYLIISDIIKKSNLKLNDENLSLGADKVVYNKGVVEFLEMLSNNDIDNYLLSSGIKVYLNETIISKYFKDIYATTFNYDETGETVGIDFLMSDKNKVTAIKEILTKNNIKYDDCKEIIYIGDGLTDYYAMEYVKKNNGISIFIYQKYDSDELSSMKEKDVVSFFAKADYSKDSELYKYIKKICKID